MPLMEIVIDKSITRTQQYCNHNIISHNLLENHVFSYKIFRLYTFYF